MRLCPVEEDVRALVQNDQRKIEDRFDLCAPIQPITYRPVYSGRVLLVVAVSPGEESEDRVLIQNPHPKLVDHYRSLNLADIATALGASILVLLVAMTGPRPLTLGAGAAIILGRFAPTLWLQFLWKLC